MADKYCQTKGFSQSDEENYFEVDESFNEKCKEKGYKFLKVMPS
jgi:hypothetical protein